MTNQDAIDELNGYVRCKVDNASIPAIDMAIKALRAINKMCDITEQYRYKIDCTQPYELLLEILKEVAE